MAAGQVNDGETTEAQPYRPVQVMALVIGLYPDSVLTYLRPSVTQLLAAVGAPAKLAGGL